jgi:hypothetical protein
MARERVERLVVVVVRVDDRVAEVVDDRCVHPPS